MNARFLGALAWDLAMAAAAWVLGALLRVDFQPGLAADVLRLLPYVVAVYACAFAAFGLHRGLWRYAGVPELLRILGAVLAGAVTVPIVLQVLSRSGAPSAVHVIAAALLALLLAGSRLAVRAWHERKSPQAGRPSASEPVLVLGAGEAAARLLRDLENSTQWRAVGLLDDDPTKRGGAIRGVKVIGALSDIGKEAAALGVKQAVIAMPGASREARKQAVEICTDAGIRVMTVPAHDDIVSGRVSISALRPVELDDLLGRDAVQLDDVGLAGLLKGKRVLVTGAGGSIGAELCRQIARFEPQLLVLQDLSEFALYSIEREFAERASPLPVAAVIGDAKDPLLMQALFARHAPQVVFHAAAYKHVPLMEDENAHQAVLNNALSTLVAGRAARAAGSEKFVLVSTDKAVNPSSVMGASKRLAEMLCQRLQEGGATQFITVRFGNVIGSTGSVVPLFREQIARGGPVTVTHPEVERYFMSIPEAAQLVLQAALMGKGQEVFLLEMGKPVKIADLARQLIRLSGYTEQQIAIRYTGLRPGEKLAEELLADAEQSLPTPHPKLRVAKVRAVRAELLEQVATWLEAPESRDAAAVRGRLRDWIPEYTPSSGA